MGTREARWVRGPARGCGARPHLGPDLVAALAGLDVHDLPHARCVWLAVRDSRTAGLAAEGLPTPLPALIG